MGNPPFVGYSMQSDNQKKDILSVYLDEKGKLYKTAGKIDFVAGWYFKAAQLMNQTTIRTAFVSTNSITQGEQVAGVWKPIYDRFGIHIDFAYQTFKWASEARDKAVVHCVIVGFSQADYTGEQRIYSGDAIINKVEQINPYLVEAPVVFIEGARKPISQVPLMHRGSQPTDDGNFILQREELTDFLKVEPNAKQWIRPFMMGKDFIDRKPCYCLWLVGANPSALKQCSRVMERIRNIKEFREKSTKAATRKKAETPTLFDENQQPNTNFVAIPVVSSERRRYIPMDFMGPETIAGNKLFVVENAELYHFALLTSNVHMAWMRAVCGRLKSDYSYSNTIVYNNFVWPEPTDKQKAMIEKTAQEILNTRALYPDSSFADLYDETVMPSELSKAHQLTDRAVELELLRTLAEAEEDVRDNRVAPASETFEEIRQSLLKRRK